MRLDKKTEDAWLVKKAKDRIQFWRFEGEELWKVTRSARKKTVGVMKHFVKKWKVLEKEMAEEGDPEPSILEYVRKLTASINDSE